MRRMKSKSSLSLGLPPERREMYKILAIYGPSGSGKNFVMDKLLEELPNLTNRIIPFTTRPKRENEQDGIDYYFEKAINILRNRNSILTLSDYEVANGEIWFYGTSITELKENELNVGIFTPKEIENLIENEELEVTPLFISSSDRIRLLRGLNRESKVNCKELCRRFLQDNKDFANVSFVNQLILENDYIDKNDWADLVNSIKEKL